MRRPYFLCLILTLVLAVPAVSFAHPLNLEVSEDVDDGEVSPLASVSEGSIRLYLPLALSNFGTASGTISPGAGGTVSTADGQVTVSAPPGAVNTMVTLTIERSDASRPSGFSDAGMVFDIHAYDAAGNPVTTFAEPLLVTLSYAGLDDFSLSVANLAIYHHEADGSWRELETTVDAGACVARAYTTQLSAFGLFAPPGIVTHDPDDDPETPYPLGMTVDAAGNLYWLDFSSWYIQKLAPGATVAEPYYNYGSMGFGMDLEAADLDIDRSTGDLYFTNGTKVFKVTQARQQLVVYDSTAGYSYDTVDSIGFDQRDGSLYIAGKWSIIQINPQTGDLIKKLPQPSYSSSSRIRDVAVDSEGRVFVVTTDWAPGTVPFNAQYWGSMAYLESPDAYAWTFIVSGLAFPRRLGVDSQDTLYVSNVMGDAITVVSGDAPMVSGFIRTADIPRGLAVGGNTLWVGAEGGVYTFPRSRRDAPAGNLSAVIAPAGTISGEGSLLTVQASLTETVPAHHVLRIGGAPVRDLVGLSENTLTYKLPDILWTDAGWARKMDHPSGSCSFGEGTATVSCGAFTMPEWGNWELAAWGESGDTIHLAEHEWLVWSAYDAYRPATSVVSHQGLFEAWDTTKGSWIAYQFNQSGAFSFTVNAGGEEYLLNVVVTRMGDLARSQRFQVDPTRGGTLYNRGGKLQIPAGALPGTEPYTVTMLTVGNAPDLQFAEAYSAYSNEYQVAYDPEPDHLNAAIVFSMPYDEAALPDVPGGAIYDATLRDYIAVESETRDGYVTITFPEGDYTAAQALGQVAGLRAQDAVVGKSGIWEAVTGSINTFGQSLWWASGLPNAKVVDTNFGIIYHTADGVLESYAQSLLNALNDARNLYISMGYDVPDNQVLVKISPWATKLTDSDGFVPRVSMLGTWTIVVNDKLDTDGIKATAAHEFFHVTQRETMRSDGFAPRWWMEGTATWAEYLIDHAAESYKDRIYFGSDFLNAPYYAWNGELSVDQEYATVAFILYLQECGEDVILNIFKRLNATVDIYQAIRLTLGMDYEQFGTFYGEFARDYWQKNYATAADWNLSLAFKKVRLTSASNSILDDDIGALSSGVIYAYYNTTDTVPDSFTEATGSVVRAPETWPYTQIYTLDEYYQAMGGAYNFLGEVDPHTGFTLSKLGDYKTSHGPYFIYVNADPDVQFSTSHLQLVMETPTLNTITPDTVLKNQWSSVTLSGGGFGPVQGSVTATNGDVTVLNWSETCVDVLVKSDSSSDMSLRVVHAKGVRSNPESVQVTTP